MHAAPKPGQTAQQVPSSSLDLIDFSGFWTASYGSHGIELVEIQVHNGYLVARKITGDPHVPAGEISFEVDLKQGGKGRIQIAEKGFRNPEWSPGRLVAPFDFNTFIFEWADVRRRFTRVPVSTLSSSISFSCQQYIFPGDPSFPRAQGLS